MNRPEASKSSLVAPLTQTCLESANFKRSRVFCMTFPNMQSLNLKQEILLVSSHQNRFGIPQIKMVRIATFKWKWFKSGLSPDFIRFANDKR